MIFLKLTVNEIKLHVIAEYYNKKKKFTGEHHSRSINGLEEKKNYFQGLYQIHKNN